MTLYFTAEEQKQFIDDLNKVYFHSDFGFLNSHNGFRKESVHLFLGVTSGGKSTLVRSIIRDVLFHRLNNPFIAIWLSEESTRAYKAQFASVVNADEKLLKTCALSEIDANIDSVKFIISWIESTRPDIWIIDNITTSKFYEGKTPEVQASVFAMIKEVTTRLEIVTIIFAHTGSNIGDNLDRPITINDIRGSRNLANAAEFGYVMQRFKVKSDYYPAIHILKHRSQPIVHDLYFLKFDSKTRSYVGDQAVTFDQWAEVYGKRNKLPR